MKKRFTEEQIAYALKRHPHAEPPRPPDVSLDKQILQDVLSKKL